VTSIAVPPVAVWYRLAGEWQGRRAPRRDDIQAVLFDRDGTLVHDIPYNGDPALVSPLPGARHAVDGLRAAGLRTALVTNQSGVGRGLLAETDVTAVNDRVEELLGPFDAVAVCAHAPDAECGCRKPQPGLVHRAAVALGVEPAACVVIGDIGSDVDAALAAGARAVLVPTGLTRREEVDAARSHPSDRVAVAADLDEACRWVLARRSGAR
jgi:histidinol-phosphate phosphatase family protein